ncbi:MAG TPA: toast rack family protein [Anaerolineales bacterium]|jgi:hypothetical protein
MRTYTPLLLVLSLAVSSLACSSTIDAPSARRVDPGPLVMEDIRIERPAAAAAELQLEFAAGELTIRPGATDYLVEGTASYNIDQLAPQIEQDGDRVTLSSGDVQSLDDLEFGLDLDLSEDTINRWDLTLSPAPMSLEIAGGAFAGNLDLGGLSLEQLEANIGAADVSLDFSSPNQTPMETLDVNAGATALSLLNLGNARFEQLRFQGGAGDYTLNFEGQWQADAEGRIEASFGQLVLVIPEGLNVSLVVDESFANMNLPPGFSRQGNSWVQSGSGPSLSLQVEIGAGNLEVVRP